MSLHKKLLALAAPAALLGLSACAAGLPTEVSRFQAMPAPQGQSFAVIPAEGEKGGLEFAQYAGLVARHLTALGYSEAQSSDSASLVVELDYGVDEGRRRVVARPDPFGPGYGFGYRRPYHYSRYGYGYGGRYRSPFYYGWDDPWYGGGYGYDRIDSYTVYESELEMNIRGRDGKALFEGRAEARSADDDLTEIVPNLIEAMFTDFPGRSGETVRITVPARRNRDGAR